MQRETPSLFFGVISGAELVAVGEEETAGETLHPGIVEHGKQPEVAEIVVH